MREYFEAERVNKKPDELQLQTAHFEEKVIVWKWRLLFIPGFEV
jgi:hypothetical protein